MNKNKCTVYSDESSYNDGRYRSIAMISLKTEFDNKLNEKVSEILKESGMSEFKWSKLGSARERLAAIKLIDFSIQKIVEKTIRIDILIWDTFDSRHDQVKRRDDIKNLQLMYYHLMKNVLNNRWGSDILWSIKPDEQSAIDWHTLKKTLNYSANKKQVIDFDLEDLYKISKEFNITEIEQVCSKEHPLIQLADLYAGLSIYSRNCYQKYDSFLNEKSSQQVLFPEFKNAAELSKKDKARCEVLESLCDRCKQNKLEISLESSHGLKTRNPHEPLNFWWYTPQSPHDKAPTKPK